jgi:hypothetical protein
MELIDKILEAGNLTKACIEVVKNKGAGGVDKMPVRKLKQYLDNNRGNLCNSVHSGNYLPQPIRGKQIPKGNGKKRLLGIPTAVDRMLQQAVLRVVMPLYEPHFSDVKPNQAYQWSRTRMGGCPPAGGQSPILGTTITIASLKKRGYKPMLDTFYSISPNYSNSLFPAI